MRLRRLFALEMAPFDEVLPNYLMYSVPFPEQIDIGPFARRRSVWDAKLSCDQDSNGIAALQGVFEDNRDRLLRFLALRCRDASLAEDLMQEASIKLVTFKPKGPITDPLAYAYKMCENLVYDAMRSERQRQTRETKWEGRDGEPNSSPVNLITPERQILERDLLQKTLSELKELPDRTYSIFVAFRVDGMSQKQIAAETGISLSAVEKHLQRAYGLVLDIRKRFDAGES